MQHRRKISEESYQGIAMWMTDKEKSKWESAYKKQSNGNYKLKDKSKENMEKLDKTFSEPILVYSMISQTQDKKNNNENTGQDMSEYMKEIDMDSLDNQAKMDLAAVQNGTMTQEQFMAAHFDLIRDTVRDKMGSAIDSMGDSLVQSSAISFVKKEYKKIME